MPCWEVQTMSVEFVAKHIDLLEKALQAAKFKYTINGNIVTIDNGAIKIDLKAEKAEIQYSYGTSKNKLQEKLNVLKKAYSVEALKKAALMNGWSMGKVAEKGNTYVGQMVKY